MSQEEKDRDWAKIGIEPANKEKAEKPKKKDK